MFLHLYSKFIDYNFSLSFVNQFDTRACLSEGVGEGICQVLKGFWFERGCQNYPRFSVAILLLVIYVAFTIGMGTIPSALDVEIYSLIPWFRSRNSDNNKMDCSFILYLQNFRFASKLESVENILGQRIFIHMLSNSHILVVA